MPTLSVGGDYVVVDNLETLAYTSQTLGVLSIPNANRSKASSEYQAGRHFMDVALAQETVSFNIWVQECPSSFTPVIGDTFTDGEGITWVVHSQSINTLRTRWKLMCLILK